MLYLSTVFIYVSRNCRIFSWSWARRRSPSIGFSFIAISSEWRFSQLSDTVVALSGCRGGCCDSWGLIRVASSYRVTEDGFCGCSNVFLPERHSNIIQLHYIVHDGLILSVAQLPIGWWPCRTRLLSVGKVSKGWRRTCLPRQLTIHPDGHF